MSDKISNWADLRPRILTAIAMIVVGVLAIWQGGEWLRVLLALCGGLMVWELSQVVSPPQKMASRFLGVLTSLSIMAFHQLPQMFALVSLLSAPLIGSIWLKQGRAIFAGYSFVILITCLSIIGLRDHLGVSAVLWLVAVVVASDTFGYFAGRMLGGPKFWPRISPKKTWSGTIAGWIGAGFVGWLFIGKLDAGVNLILFSAIIAFAAQLGDISESAIKRKFGVKDASNLLPGHGGLMDRFDGLIGAALVTCMFSLATGLPMAWL